MAKKPQAGAPFDLARIAAEADPDSQPTYLSLYVDLTDAQAEATIEDRTDELRRAAPAASLANLKRSLKQARAELGRLKARNANIEGAAVFACAKRGFIEGVPLGAPVPTRVVLDSSPYVRPLARFADEYESFALVLMDNQAAAVHVVSLARARKVARAGHDILGRHRRGGMSQMRFQRRRQGVLDRFHAEVADRLRRTLDEESVDRTIVAGPGPAKSQFVARLPTALRKTVIATQDLDWDEKDERPAIRHFVRLARRHADRAAAESLEELRGRLLQGELAVAGPFRTVRAARDGRVETLVVVKGQVAGGRKCEAHQTFFEVGGACECGQRGIRVDLANEAVEYAARSDAWVEFVPKRGAAFLVKAGGVGAVLAW